jgi:hypothetical protein
LALRKTADFKLAIRQVANLRYESIPAFLPRGNNLVAQQPEAKAEAAAFSRYHRPVKPLG